MKEVIKKNGWEILLYICLIIAHLTVQTLSSMKIICFYDGLRWDMRIGFWIGIAMLLGERGVRFIIKSWKELKSKE